MFGNYQQPKKEDLTLYLHFTISTLSYVIFDDQLNVFIYFKVYKNLQSQIDWDMAFEGDPNLKETYKVTKASFTNPYFTLIPTELYNPLEYKTYLNFAINEGDMYFQGGKTIKNLKAEVLFCIEREPKAILNKYFPNCEVFHSSIPLITGAIQEPQGIENHKIRLYVYLWNNHDMEVMVIQGRGLLLYNHFLINSSEEFMYYPLYICKQLNLERNQIELCLGGVLNRYHPNSKALIDYFEDFHYLRLPSAYLYHSSLMADGDIGLIGSLVYLSLCE